MTDKTEQKILDAALKIFAEKGYKGATTRAIAAKADVNDSTLFRKFQTKQNLFSSVMQHNYQKMIEGFRLILSENEFKSQKDFLETLINNLMILVQNNSEFIKITLNENQRIPSNFLEEFVNHLSAYVEKNIPHKDIDYKIFVFSILSFIYLLILDYGGAFPDRDKAIETFIDNTVKFF